MDGPREKGEGRNSDNASIANNPMFSGTGFDTLGAGYDGGKSFKIEFAKPSPEQRELASVYDDWLTTTPDLTRIKGLKGLHVIPPALLDSTKATPLLNAHLADGTTVPLAVASFPGRGRALWILSDSMWRMAMAETSGIARETYDRFMLGGLQWLLRQDLRKPLIANRFSLRRGGPSTKGAANDSINDSIFWTVHLTGPATRHLDFVSPPSEDRTWRLGICGVVQDGRAIAVDRIAGDQFVLSGTLAPGVLPTGTAGSVGAGGRPFCKIEVEARDKSFGSVGAVSSAFIQTPLNDRQALDSLAWLRKLQERSAPPSELIMVGEASPYESPASAGSKIGRWLREHATADEANGLESALAGEEQQPARDDPYWPFRRWWAWALMAMMPVEVLARRLRKL